MGTRLQNGSKRRLRTAALLGISAGERSDDNGGAAFVRKARLPARGVGKPGQALTHRHNVGWRRRRQRLATRPGGQLRGGGRNWPVVRQRSLPKCGRSSLRHGAAGRRGHLSAEPRRGTSRRTGSARRFARGVTTPIAQRKDRCRRPGRKSQLCGRHLDVTRWLSGPSHLAFALDVA